jgi:hypothetical protein
MSCEKVIGEVATSCFETSTSHQIINHINVNFQKLSRFHKICCQVVSKLITRRPPHFDTTDNELLIDLQLSVAAVERKREEVGERRKIFLEAFQNQNRWPARLRRLVKNHKT